jgi:hypothetical protein
MGQEPGEPRPSDDERYAELAQLVLEYHIVVKHLREVQRGTSRYEELLAREQRLAKRIHQL